MVRLALIVLLGCLAARPAASAPASLVIVGGTLIDGTTREPVAESAIVVRDGKFAAVTTAAQAASLPPDARRLDARGKWLIPGLIDAHVHDYEAARQVDLVLRDGRVVWTR